MSENPRIRIYTTSHCFVGVTGNIRPIGAIGDTRQKLGSEFDYAIVRLLESPQEVRPNGDDGVRVQGLVTCVVVLLD